MNQDQRLQADKGVQVRTVDPVESADVVEQRIRHLQELGMLDVKRDEMFNVVARKTLQHFDGDAAVVNIVSGTNQVFVGVAAADPELEANLNEMGMEGPCPHTMTRPPGIAFPLENLMDYSRFRACRLVDVLQALSYLGAAVRDPRTQIALGTVCVVRKQPTKWEQPQIQDIKRFADMAARTIYRRSGLALP